MMSRVKLWKTVLVSWLYTLMGVFNIAVITIIVGFVLTRFTGPRVVALMIVSTITLSVFILFMGEVLVNLIFSARKPDPVEDAMFIRVVDKIAKKRVGMWIKPRAYILEVGAPNAMAYGVGLPGLAALGVSRELIALLTEEELEGVLGHECAHIRCRDIGIITVIGLFGTLIDKCAEMLSGRNSLVGGTILLRALMWFFTAIAKGLFSLMRFAISQEREIAADALGAFYVGTPQPLISALRKLSAERPINETRDIFGNEHSSNKDGTFSDVMISHPGLSERIASLESIVFSPAQT